VSQLAGLALGLEGGFAALTEALAPVTALFEGLADPLAAVGNAARGLVSAVTGAGEAIKGFRGHCRGAPTRRLMASRTSWARQREQRRPRRQGTGRRPSATLRRREISRAVHNSFS
jgi:hypothetical protein